MVFEATFGFWRPNDASLLSFCAFIISSYKVFHLATLTSGVEKESVDLLDKIERLVSMRPGGVEHPPRGQQLAADGSAMRSPPARGISITTLSLEGNYAPEYIPADLAEFRSSESVEP